MEAYADYMREVSRLKDEQPRFQKVEIEVNTGCNRRCSYCFLATRRRESVVEARRRVMEMELYERVVSQLADLEFEGELNYHFYGEPLINKRLHEYVALARAALPRCTIVLYTNGDLLTPAKYRQLRDAGVGRFYVTFHNDVVPQRLGEVLAQPDVVYDTRSTILLNNRGGYLGRNPFEAVRTLPCIYPSVTVIVTIDGNVLPCSCDFDERMSFGNVRSRHLREIWDSEKARAFRRDLLDGARASHALCEGCDYYSGIVGLPSAAEAHRNVPPPPRARPAARPFLPLAPC